MERARATAAMVALVTCLAAGTSPAEAQRTRRIFLNGVDLTDTEVTSQKFRSCEVRFDEHGNIHITAPGFEIKKQPASGEPGKSPDKTAPAAATLKNSYRLTWKESRRGATRYHITILVNGRRVTTVRSNAGDGSLDITRFVKPGPNKVRLVAAKQPAAKGKARITSAKHTLVVRLVETATEAKQAKRPRVTTRELLRYARNAAQTATYNNTYRFTGR